MTYCPAVNNYLYLRSDGMLGVCCHFNQDTVDEKSVSIESIKQPDDIFKISVMRDTKASLEKGTFPKACGRCEANEKLKVRSNREVLIKQTGTQIKSKSTTGPTLINFELGNLCNLACIYCNSQFSTKWIEDEKVMLEEGLSDINPVHLKHHKWHEDPKTQDMILSALDHVRGLEFTGGEPLLSSFHIKILEHAVLNKRAHEIDLFYNTNGTMLPKKVTDLWGRFKSVYLNFSIDSLNPAIESYIRWPSNITEVLNNIQKTKSLPGQIRTGIHVTCNILNLLELKAVYEYAKENNFEFSIGVVKYPDFLAPQNLAETIKRDLIDSWTSETHKCFDDMSKLLKQPADPNLLDQTRRFLQILDKRRNLDSKKVFPFLFED